MQINWYPPKSNIIFYGIISALNNIKYQNYTLNITISLFIKMKAFLVTHV